MDVQYFTLKHFSGPFKVVGDAFYYYNDTEWKVITLPVSELTARLDCQEIPKEEYIKYPIILKELKESVYDELLRD